MKILFYGFRHEHIFGLYEKALSNDRVKVVACLEDDQTTRDLVEAQKGIKFDKEKSYEAWLESDVDVVAIGLSYGDRGSAVIKALKKGKHVIIDKPVCIKLSHLKKIKNLALKKNLKVICMLDLRYTATAFTLKNLIEQNAFGEVRNISFTGQHFLNYGVRPAWYFEKGKHGGTLNDLAIHGIDLIRYLTGKEFAKITGASAWNAFAKEQPDFKDCALFLAKLTNGAGVIADVSYSAPAQVYNTDIYWNFKFWCDKGLVTYSFNSNDLTVYYMNEKEPKIIKTQFNGANYLEDLLNDIESGSMENTISMLKSSQVALQIQRKADR
jgi:predicted dehydrogenase